MPEQELNPAATKFISSLVRSLQILCNGQVEFNETIELVGHINVKIDHKYKFDYIVDEHVSKEGEDSSTTFLSNSYHSCRPTKQTNKKSDPSALEQDLIFSGIPHNTQRRGKQMKNMHEMIEKHCDNSSLDRENEAQNYSVSVEPRDKQYNEHNQMVVKLEGGEDSNDCMVLPASPVDYEGEGNRTETFPVPGTSSSFNDSPGNQTIHTRKRRKVNNQRAEDTDQAKEVNCLGMKSLFPTSHVTGVKKAITRKTLTIEVKQDIIRQSNAGVRVVDLAAQYGVNKSTIGTILKNQDSIKDAKVAKGVTRVSTKNRSALVEQMEDLLIIWINEIQRYGDRIPQEIICAKAKSIYEELKQCSPKSSSREDVFKASRGWFRNFRRRTEAHGIVMYSDATCSIDNEQEEDISQHSHTFIKTEVDY